MRAMDINSWRVREYGLTVEVDERLMMEGETPTPAGRRLLRLVLDEFPIYEGRGEAGEPHIVDERSFFLPGASGSRSNEKRVREALLSPYDYSRREVDEDHFPPLLTVKSPHTLLTADLTFIQLIEGVQGILYVDERIAQRKWVEMSLDLGADLRTVLSAVDDYME